jgi:hypothetical protein
MDNANAWMVVVAVLQQVPLCFMLYKPDTIDTTKHKPHATPHVAHLF